MSLLRHQMLWLIGLTVQLYSQTAFAAEPAAWFSNFADPVESARYKSLRSITDLKTDAAGLRCRLTGKDPIIQGPPLRVAKGADYALRGRVFSETGGTLQVFIVRDGKADEKLSVKISVPAKAWHDFSARIPELDAMTSLRIDPPGESGEFQLAWLNIEAPGASGVVRVIEEGNGETLLLEFGELPPGRCELVELNLTEDWSKVTSAETKALQVLANNEVIRIQRYTKGDRQLHGFAIRCVSGQGDKFTLVPVGWPRYVEEVKAKPIRATTLKPTTSVKGLQMQMLDDALALGIQHATYNLSLASLLDPNHDPANISLRVEGEKFTIRRDALDRLPIKQLNAAGVRVYLILLGTPTNQPELKRLLHPARSSNGKLAAFNTADEAGLRAVRACLTYLADYYSGNDPEHARFPVDHRQRGQLASLVVQPGQCERNRRRKTLRPRFACRNNDRGRVCAALPCLCFARPPLEYRRRSARGFLQRPRSARRAESHRQTLGRYSLARGLSSLSRKFARAPQLAR